MAEVLRESVCVVLRSDEFERRMSVNCAERREAFAIGFDWCAGASEFRLRDVFTPSRSGTMTCRCCGRHGWGVGWRRWSALKDEDEGRWERVVVACSVECVSLLRDAGLVG